MLARRFLKPENLEATDGAQLKIYCHVLKKLASYPKQNGLAKAQREIGRIQRTLFMLDWFRDSALRRRVQAGLNKGEARDALARAILLHRLGEIRDRKPEN